MVSISSGLNTMSTWTIGDDRLTEKGTTSVVDYLGAHGSLRGLLALQENHAFLLWDDMVQLYDVSDRSRPTRKGQWSIAGVGEGAMVQGDSVFVAGGYKGLIKSSLIDPQ